VSTLRCACSNVLKNHRDFLLFMPHGTPNLRTILSYYSAAASVNQEGDVHVNDPLQGIGKYTLPILYPWFYFVVNQENLLQHFLLRYKH